MALFAPKSKELRRLEKRREETPFPTVLAWSQSCFDCALKRGWSAEHLLNMPRPFFCVHRTDLQNKERLCAVWKNRVEEFQFK